MEWARRSFLESLATAALPFDSAAGKGATSQMFGMIGKMMAAAGKREELISILLEGTGQMPGCLSYIVAKDPADENAIWITEVWDNKRNHDASLALPAVKNAIARAKPMITAFETPTVTTPVGGVGLSKAG